MINIFYSITTFIIHVISLLWTISDLERIKNKYAVVITVSLLGINTMVSIIKSQRSYRYEKIDIVYVKDIEESVNVRDENNKVIDKLIVFTKVKIITKSPNWVEIEYSNKKRGWIEEKYIKEIKIN